MEELASALKKKDEHAVDIILEKYEDGKKYNLPFRPLMLAAAISEWALEYFMDKTELNKQSSGSIGDALIVAHTFSRVSAKELSNTDIDLHDEYKLTPLLMAIIFGPEKNVTTLLSARADVSKKTNSGRTALDYTKIVGLNRFIQPISFRMKARRSKSIATLKLENFFDELPKEQNPKLEKLRSAMKELQRLRKKEEKQANFLQLQLSKSLKRIQLMKDREKQLKEKEQKMIKYDTRLGSKRYLDV
mmetsp:Transcript_10709/g.15961  ORF Transcript_10709/g.15961 Transcript_10709/m.15961 type:complete len:246 (-) Transcript_10709:125-862(-)